MTRTPASQQLDGTITGRAKFNKGRLIMPPHVWRQRVQDLVQEIIAPETLSWMDDDEGTSASHVCNCSLYELQVRFEQWVLRYTDVTCTDDLQGARSSRQPRSPGFN